MSEKIMNNVKSYLQLNYTIEVEVTNFCNAECVFCANKILDRTRGFIDVGQFECFIKLVKEQVDNNIFRNFNMNNYPRITFCGLGEPLLHPNIENLIRLANKSGFYTQLVTNGVLLTRDKLLSLIDAGLNELDISFHSINKDNYYAITGLVLDDLIKAIVECKDILNAGKIKTMFWRVKHPQKAFVDSLQDELLYMKCLDSLGLRNCKILGPSEPWSRDGYVSDSKCDVVQDSPFWCNKIVFTTNIDWQGNLVLCCNDYNNECVNLGNVFEADFCYEKYLEKKMKIFTKENLPEICSKCRRWPDNEVYDILESEGVNCEEFFESLNSVMNYLTKKYVTIK